MNMDDQPLVSVLMTVFNRDPYLSEAIESVMASTYKNWELILVDDQSTDNSVNIARSYAEKDSRITLYINEQNLGDYPNRNKAASYAKGKYLKYVDSDDKIYPHGLEILVYYMEQFPEAGYGLCSMIPDEAFMYPVQLSPRLAYKQHFFEGHKLFDKPSLSSMIKRSLFEEVSGFANVRHFGDYEMWLKLSKITPVLLLPDGVIWYRISDGQEKQIRQRNPLNALKTFNCTIEHIESLDCPLSETEKETVVLHYNKLIASLILFAFRRVSFDKGHELKKLSKFSYFDILKFKLSNKGYLMRL